MNQKSEHEFYEKIKDWDFSQFQIIEEKLTNWDMYQILRSITNKESRILDIGTGGGERVLEDFPTNVKEIIATDFSNAMLETAKENLKKSDRKNITFRWMDNLHMDLPEEYFDVVVARNTVTDPKQIYQVLKPNGYLMIRGVDMYDCHELKRIFGRGQAYQDKKPISIIDYEAVLDAGFQDVELVPIHVREFYKNKDTLYNFLLKVPILNDCSEEKENFKDYYEKELEEDKLKKYIAKNTYDKGIRLLRRYYGITARKK